MGPYYETRLMEHLNADDAREAPRTRLTCRSLAADGEGLFSYGAIMLAVVGIMVVLDFTDTPDLAAREDALAALSADYSSRP